MFIVLFVLLKDRSRSANHKIYHSLTKEEDDPVPRKAGPGSAEDGSLIPELFPYDDAFELTKSVTAGAKLSTNMPQDIKVSPEGMLMYETVQS